MKVLKVWAGIRIGWPGWTFFNVSPDIDAYSLSRLTSECENLLAFHAMRAIMIWLLGDGMGTRSDKLRQAQAEIERGPEPLTKATEARFTKGHRLGVVTYLLLGLAVLNLFWLLEGRPETTIEGVVGCALLAWANEYLRARRRARAEK
jgi:hypothetical protein